MNKITIYTDGGCFPNPGMGGYGALFIREDGTHKVLLGGVPETTNNRMEIQAAISALARLDEPHEVMICTDSQYVKNGMETWIISWKKNNWSRGKNKYVPVMNSDLWKQLDELCAIHSVKWHWVRGHCGDVGNETADQLALMGFEHPNRELYGDHDALFKPSEKKALPEQGPIYCCGCLTEVRARLTNGREIYPWLDKVHGQPFWKCDTCGNFVGCHHKTDNPTKPLGCIPTKELRDARKKIHEVLDPIWKSGRVDRGYVYSRLHRALGKPYHTGELSTIEDARQVYTIVLALKKELA